MNIIIPRVPTKLMIKPLLNNLNKDLKISYNFTH